MPSTSPDRPAEAVILEGFRLALAELWASDRLLIKRGLNEASVAHRLAVYLERQFPGLHVDCQYNRNSRVEESTYDFPYMSRTRQRDLRRNLMRQGLSEPEADAATGAVAHAYPGIIVHLRERSDFNLLVVEVQVKGTRQGWSGEHDAKDKLRRYTLQGSEGQFRYGLGLYVELSVNEAGEEVTVVEEFRNGERLERKD
ncbi:hypothetical protein [Deinococcus hopiensis]|uniref:Uncharacterized protein n=1 Tax=Deinococcus hopiensis KR-140 TaxID=695939 RepID=A0A1W1V659_9DEIO|nr:hypothetical protein [Deinococcus hopiensis]SMB88887.1 hypothetical protein SAMN00790413_00210 [Deinococcus hopiensis KR-140]